MTAASPATQAWHVLTFVWTHPANRHHRWRSLARACRYQVRGRLGRPTVATIGKRARIRVSLHDTAAAKVIYANPPDWNEMWAWRRHLRPGDLFVDVGSNAGSYALWAADAGAEVVAIEPSGAAAATLRANVALNPFPITVRQCALSAEPGQMWLTRDRGTTNHLLDAPSAEAETVDVDTLDNILGDRTAAGVKIDVEGAERLVLEGARRALAEGRIGVLQIEWNAMSERVLGESRVPVADLLTGHGYRLARPDRHGVLRPVTAVPSSSDDMFAVAPRGPLCRPS
ncbi:FkbM family methyltransferase [Phytoactinopolyspora halotolerans]|uniref:FkbM family methyltransferase n=1 Tax=Phytoactinopolyspora halotolerans TaxID=1981512 RepID=A0A6L9S552_9ACTN|nr:FkbM family methyltransferase [Phytoactinopolyspora halotolerans]NEE00177.1 FkbM family methyltransferase [Phytoactinopolyspora halotolerans]